MRKNDKNLGCLMPTKFNLGTKGITLIALIITIIVLLILAGVTLNLTLGENGIIKVAEKAGKNYINSAEYEQAMLAELSNEAQNIIKNDETELTTLADISNKNIGEYIDLGNDPLGMEDTTKNWRIYYVEGSTVYVILANYLPNTTGHARNAGLTTESYVYSVYSSDRTKLLEGLNHETAWDSLANGISGAQVSGTPTLTQFKKSWNAKYTNNPITIVGDETDGFSSVSPSVVGDEDTLYAVWSSAMNCNGCWFASIRAGYDKGVWRILFDGGFNSDDYNYKTYGVRPIVSLPISTQVKHEGDIWKVQK